MHSVNILRIILGANAFEHAPSYRGHVGLCLFTQRGPEAADFERGLRRDSIEGAADMLEGHLTMLRSRSRTAVFSIMR